jgi:hypothetical protein
MLQLLHYKKLISLYFIIMGVPQECVNSSRDCDVKVQDFCNNITNYNANKDFCGCSTQVLASAPDPKLGAAPTKCWAQSCNKNAKAYQFEFVKDEKCPDICIDESSITALGSNITGSSFNQASCGGENVQKQDPKVKQSVTQLYTYGAGVIVAFVLILLCMSLSISSVMFIK